MGFNALHYGRASDRRLCASAELFARGADLDIAVGRNRELIVHHGDVSG
jgi:uncharacterized protein (DUF1810 family)